MVESAAFFEHGNVEPHAGLLNQPSDDKQLFKIMKVSDFIRSVSNSYLHFQRVDSYKDFPTADAYDGEQPAKDRAVNASVTFEKAPDYSAADYYDKCRARTYACSFSLINSRLIWERYGVGDPVGKICIVFNFGKLKSVLNQTVGNVPGQSALMVGNIQCKQFFYINYGMIEYVDTSAIQTNISRLSNPIVYAYMKDKDQFSGENELRITMAALGIGNFALADNTVINFPSCMGLSFDFRRAYADGTIAYLISQNNEVACHLAQELEKLKIMVQLDGV